MTRATTRGGHARLKGAVMGVIVGALCVAAVALDAPHVATPAPAPLLDAGTPGDISPHPHPMLLRSDAASAAVVQSTSSAPCLTVPVLVYHYIRVAQRSGLPFNLSVTPLHFQEQMDWLRLAGGHPVTLAQVYAAMHGGPRLPPHPVVLTFDDGYSDFATAAAPILEREGFVATSFVVSGFLGRPGYMTAQQVQQVAAAGIVIDAHSVNHPDLVALSPQIADTEITASRALLQQLIGRPVLDFAYPYGDVDAQVAQMVQRAGFRDAVTMTYGTIQCAGNVFLLPRIRVGGTDTVASFARSAGIAAPPPGWVDPGMPLSGPPDTTRTR